MTNLAHHFIEMPIPPEMPAQHSQPIRPEREHPQPMASDDLRAEHRFTVNQRVSMTLIGGSESRLDAVVRNVSRKGMSLELDCILLSGEAIKVEWGDHVLVGTIKHLNQRGGSTILGVELFSTWESFLEEILARHAEELEKSRLDLQSLTGLASHEMRETLAVALLHMNLLAKGAEAKQDAECLRLVRCAQSAVARMRELTQDLATYTRLITEPVRMAPVNCDRLVNGLTSLAAAVDATVTHDPLPTVMGDGCELQMVFQNLISNGLKFNRQQVRHVHVSARFKAREAGEWLFSVSDNGIGIEPQAQSRLFQPLTRLHDAAEFPGSGLGLALARRIIEKHGGHMWVKSKPGKGSVFQFTVPARPKPWE